MHTILFQTIQIFHRKGPRPSCIFYFLKSLQLKVENIIAMRFDQARYSFWIIIDHGEIGRKIIDKFLKFEL